MTCRRAAGRGWRRGWILGRPGSHLPALGPLAGSLFRRLDGVACVSAELAAIEAAIIAPPFRQRTKRTSATGAIAHVRLLVCRETHLRNSSSRAGVGTVSSCERQTSRATSSCAQAPLQYLPGSCPCRPRGRSADRNGCGRATRAFLHSVRSRYHHVFSWLRPAGCLHARARRLGAGNLINAGGGVSTRTGRN